jgi:predicted RND superfamily exporter protein
MLMMVGLGCLAISPIETVRQFGIAGAIGCGIAFFVAIAMTPAVLSIWPSPAAKPAASKYFEQTAVHAAAYRQAIAAATVLLMIGGSVGLTRLTPEFDPLQMLRPRNPAAQGMVRLEREVETLRTIDVTIDFGARRLSPTERASAVRAVSAAIDEHPAVRNTLSLATFLPARLPESTEEMDELFSSAGALPGSLSRLAARDAQLWRITVQIDARNGSAPGGVSAELAAIAERSLPANSAAVGISGTATIIEEVRTAGLGSFWKILLAASLASLGTVIVMQRSIKNGLLAVMVGAVPACVVCGGLAWTSTPLDIGMLLAGGMALAFTTEAAAMFLLEYAEQYRLDRNVQLAIRRALTQSGPTITQSALVAGVCLLALTTSGFAPVARMGALASIIAAAGVLSPFYVLPSILGLRRERRPAQRPNTNTIARPNMLGDRRFRRADTASS